MKMLAALAVVFAVAVPGVSFGQTAGDRCAEFAANIETNQRNLAYLHARSFIDRSAVQASHRAAEEQNVLALLKMNLDLMAAAKCSLPTKPITRGGYQAGGLACANSSGSTETMVAACSNWKYDGTAAEPDVTR
ncbi:MAG: hypothetical protein IT546_11130 [Caulobacteraceae bacterium]|nr:hypothetical protein [Caulobacteraceae bacterium]